MLTEKLLELYYSHKGTCCKCGCGLEDDSGFGLGSIFVLDREGNFYCTNCDGKFKDDDERIFEAKFYEDDGFIGTRYCVAAIGYDENNNVNDEDMMLGIFKTQEEALEKFVKITTQKDVQREVFLNSPTSAYLKVQLEMCEAFAEYTECIEVLNEFDIFAPEETSETETDRITLNVGFINAEERDDETQLDIDASSFEASLVDFANLLFSLRNEMGIKEITYVNESNR